MSESFDDMMRREFGEDFGQFPELQELLCELLERHAMPHEGVLHVLELTMDLLRPMARLRSFADHCEAEAVVRPGFRREMETLIVEQLSILIQRDT